MEELTGGGSENVRRHARRQRCEWAYALRSVLRMVEEVVELRPQFEELSFANVHSFQHVEVPVVLTRSAQRVAAKRTAPTSARKQSDVLRVRRIDTSAARVRIGVERRTNRHATWIGC